MKSKALVVVLGELARSPRMQYHCLSLASSDFQVTVIGYAGSEACCGQLEANKNIKQILMNEPPNFKRYIPSFLAYMIKTIWQSIALWTCLIMAFRPDIIIVQNPPSVPTLPVLCFYKWIVRSKLIIDWHNYGYSLLSLNLKSDRHLLVKLTRWIERFFGRFASIGFCVTNAMKRDLIDNWKLNYPIHVLHDRPPQMFKPMSIAEKHDFFIRMKSKYAQFEEEICPRILHEDCKDNSRFTTLDCINDSYIYQNKRPALIMSSTSWTEDEDFTILLDALKMYDKALNGPKNRSIVVPIPVNDDHSSNGVSTCSTITDDISVNVQELPDIVCVITGKGPLKAHYENKIADYKFSNKITLILPWLTASDYPMMVGSCDFGLSLHQSSSGLDLPMKVLDMFGCGVPVLAYNYGCLNELVQNDVNGLIFNDSQELYERMIYLLHDFRLVSGYWRDNVLEHTRATKLQQYRNYLVDYYFVNRWENNWDSSAKDHIFKLVHNK